MVLWSKRSAPEAAPHLTASCNQCDQNGGPADAATLIAAYHASSRAELIARLDKRDSSMFLYLASVAAILSVFLAAYPRGALALLVIPLLGFGAALVHSQHNTVIGAIGVYNGDELQQAAIEETGVQVASWDASETLRALRGHIGTRIASSLLIFVTPALVSIALVARAEELTPVVLGLLLCSIVAATWTAASLIQAHRRRAQFRQQLHQSVGRSSGAAGRRRGPAGPGPTGAAEQLD